MGRYERRAHDPVDVVLTSRLSYVFMSHKALHMKAICKFWAPLRTCNRDCGTSHGRISKQPSVDGGTSRG